MKTFKYKIFAVLLFANYLFSSLSAEIIEVDNLKAIERLLPNLNQNSLVLSDVDETLILPDAAVLRPCGQKFVTNFVSKIFANPSSASREKHDYLFSQVLLQAKFSLLDPNSLQFIKQLQNQRIPTIALTATTPGKIGTIDQLEDWRINQLKAFGFDFTVAFPRAHYLEFQKTEEGASAPLFKSGILFSSKYPKGEVLKQFLDAIQWYPTKVVLIDDRMENLVSVQNILSEMGIDFVGFHYTAAEKLPSNFDEKIAEFQFRHLVETAKLLSDEEARNMMN